MHELHQVLSARYGGPDLDGLFVAHGLFGDLDGDQAHDSGEPVGMTSHPARDERDAPVGDAVERFAPEPLPAQQVAVDSGAVDAAYVVFVTYPEGRAEASRSYLATPGPDGRIAVLVPPEDSGGSATVLALSDGRLPEVVAELEADDFWAQARARPGESFLSFTVTLEEGEVWLAEPPWWTEHRDPLRLGGGAAVLLALVLLWAGRLSGRRGSP